MMFEYDNRLGVRQDTVSGIGPWVWISIDEGAWDGPKRDWENCHRPVIEKFCHGRAVAVQAGGCQGMYPRLLADMFEMVYTFEPDPLSFHCLVHNCARDNIIKMNCALGAKPEMVKILKSGDPRNVGMNQVQVGGRIPQIALDSLGLDACDLLMLDVEGYEMNVIEGAHQTILDHKPLIFAERSDHLIHMLEPMGYRKIADSSMDVVFSARN